MRLQNSILFICNMKHRVLKKKGILCFIVLKVSPLLKMNSSACSNYNQRISYRFTFSIVENLHRENVVTKSLTVIMQLLIQCVTLEELFSCLLLSAFILFPEPHLKLSSKNGQSKRCFICQIYYYKIMVSTVQKS